MKNKTLQWFFIAVFLLLGCGQKEMTPEEMMSALRSAGHRVEKEADIHPSIQGALEGFWISVDGSRVAAFRYGTVAKAKLKGKSLRNGINVGFWAFEHADDITAEKIKKALKQH